MSHLKARCSVEALMSNWLILQYIYIALWWAVWFSGTESHNPRMNYNKWGLMYFINCVKICGCWQRDVSETMRCAWQWWQQTVLQHQLGATGCLYCENMFWGCVSLSGSEITKLLCQLTTQHPSYTNSNNLRCRKVPSITAAVCVTVIVLGMCCINWRCFRNTDIILSDKYYL